MADESIVTEVVVSGGVWRARDYGPPRVRACGLPVTHETVASVLDSDSPQAEFAREFVEAHSHADTTPDQDMECFEEWTRRGGTCEHVPEAARERLREIVASVNAAHYASGGEPPPSPPPPPVRAASPIPGVDLTPKPKRDLGEYACARGEALWPPKFDPCEYPADDDPDAKTPFSVAEMFLAPLGTPAWAEHSSYCQRCKARYVHEHRARVKRHRVAAREGTLEKLAFLEVRGTSATSE
jgi:hypothetical protein